MALLNLLNNIMIFSGFRLEDNIRLVYTDKRLVCRNFNYIKLIDFVKFVSLGSGSTGHTGKFLIKTEVVLECDGSESLAFVLYLYALFCLECLMETFVISTTLHNTAGELVNDFNLTVFNNIVNISGHNAVSLDSLVDMMAESCIIYIHKVFYLKELLSLFNTALKECCGLCFFINYIVAVISFLCVLLVIGLGNLGHDKSFCKGICLTVEVG